MRLRTASVVSLIVTVMLIAAPAAVGLEPGVHVDPHSPSGTEYSFPLGSTRQQLGGHSSAGASAGSGPLFGVGLGRATSHRRTSGAHPGGPRHAGAGTRTGSRSGRAGAALRPEQGEAIAALGQSGSSTDALTLVLAVMALGGGGGLGLWLIARRRRSDDR
jgi:hypothetical protein